MTPVLLSQKSVNLILSIDHELESTNYLSDLTGDKNLVEKFNNLVALKGLKKYQRNLQQHNVKVVLLPYDT